MTAPSRAAASRFDNAAIALYEFKTGTGSVAYDTSGVEPAAQPDAVRAP